MVPDPSNQESHNTWRDGSVLDLNFEVNANPIHPPQNFYVVGRLDRSNHVNAIMIADAATKSSAHMNEK